MPSAASAAASSIDAPPASASSVAVARSGVAPMFVSATDARSTEPFALDDGSNGDGRPVLGAAAHLRVRPAAPSRAWARGSRRASRRRERGLEDAGEELPPGSPLAARSARDELRVEREDHRREVGGRIAVRERAADRPAMTNLRVADLAGGVRDDRAVLAEDGRRARRPCAGSAHRWRSRRRPPGRTRGRSSRPMSTRSAGRASRSFIAGSSECPPARSFASSRSPSSSIAWSALSATS